MATCLITNKSYIGFATNFKSRQRRHKKDSQKDLRNYKFYNAIKKYGWDSFVWKIIYQSKDRNHTLNEMESYFINEYDTYNNGYNSTSGGECAYPESIEKEWKVLNPDGQQFNIKNLKRFCDENLLDYSKMRKVAKGINRQHKGWRCVLADEEIKTLNKIKYNSRRKTIEFTDNQGTKYIHNGFNEFCEMNGLSNVCMRHVLNGKQKQHRGWTCKAID
jgi:group I intron endonuclease